jgi:hypothetical protein
LFQVPVKTVKRIVEEFSGAGTGLTQQTEKMVQQNDLWVQLINPQGNVIASFNTPDDFDDHYTLKDIAVLVLLVQELFEGLSGISAGKQRKPCDAGLPEKLNG